MKEKDFDAIVPRVGFLDMAEETQVEVVSICKEAYKMQHDGDFKYYKDMAIYVKTQLDKKVGGSWHIIVGKLQFNSRTDIYLTIGTNFGSFVTYETQCMYLFWLE